MTTKEKVIKKPEETFDWLEVRQSIDNSDNLEENSKDRFLRKVQENPFVPIGFRLFESAVKPCRNSVISATDDGRSPKPFLAILDSLQGLTANSINIKSLKKKKKKLLGGGCLVTLGCLGYGLYSFRQGDKIMSQKMMRARIVAQGFTVAALIGGIALTAMKHKS